MNVPFTAAQFIAVFARYNQAIWPTQLAAYAAALLALFLIVRRNSATDRVVALVLAGLWAFTGIGYHLMSFSAINPAARLFGAAFVVQAALFAVEAFRGRLSFRFARGWRSYMGAAMVAFAMAIYPVLGTLAGHGFPSGPSFGVTPCPLTIFTFGLLLMTERGLPKHLLAIPMAWALVGSTAAVALGIREDVALLVSGLAATASLLLRRKAARTTGEWSAIPGCAWSVPPRVR